jgi:prepilin-type N-terminal cleavage/methylation domain-containing protein
MRRRLNQRGGGFTLIEVMMVLVILSLLAALLVSIFGNSSGDARKAATKSAAVQTQKAIDLYRQYTLQLPDLITSWDPLTQQTTLPDGRTIGPFMDHPPVNQVVKAGDPSAIADGADPVLYTDVAPFLYDYNGGAGSGRFIAAYEPTP